MACGAATASAVASGGVAVPLAIWACGSVVLNGIAKLEEPIKRGSCDGGSTETCPIGGKGSCLQHLNKANSILRDIQSCAVPPSVSACSTAIGLRLADGAVKSLLNPDEICKPTNVCPQLKNVCNSYKGTHTDFIGNHTCICNAYEFRLPSNKVMGDFKIDCLSLGNTKWQNFGDSVQRCYSPEHYKNVW